MFFPTEGGEKEGKMRNRKKRAYSAPRSLWPRVGSRRIPGTSRQCRERGKRAPIWRDHRRNNRREKRKKMVRV